MNVTPGSPAPLRIEAVIFNWRGHERRAAALERQFAPLCPVRVVNSESAAEGRHPHWEHIGEDGYFTAQWQRALQGFDADILFHVQADASSPHFARILERCRDAMQRLGCGIYAPDVDYTPWVYDRARLRHVEGDYYEVPQTDCTCWAISRTVLEAAPPMDPATNKYGWAIDFLTIGAARSLGLRVLRDYRYKVHHPWKGAGYDTSAADVQARAVLAALPETIQQRTAELRREAQQKLGRQPLRRRLSEAGRRKLRALRSALRVSARGGT